jgi:hypothetical protein
LLVDSIGVVDNVSLTDCEDDATGATATACNSDGVDGVFVETRELDFELDILPAAFDDAVLGGDALIGVC